jgi:hypothetical protein
MKESMGKGKLVAGFVVVAAALYVGGQVAACEVANIELKDDLRDLAAQVGTKIGLDPIREDAELRAMVVRRAEDYNIELKPEQVSVRRTGSGDREVIHLAVDYQAHVHLLAHSFALHFTSTSDR